MPQLARPVDQRIAGALCLDFCNTVAWRGSARETDILANSAGYTAWCHGADLPLPGDGDTEWQRALGLRAAIFRTFLACVQGRSPAEADLAPVWSAYVSALERGKLVPAAAGAHIVWPGDDPLVPVTRSAVELICGPPRRLKLCDAPQCGWLFLDTTKNGRRRFCDMRYCGNRTRAREHYARRKAAAEPKA